MLLTLLPLLPLLLLPLEHDRRNQCQRSDNDPCNVDAEILSHAGFGAEDYGLADLSEGIEMVREEKEERTGRSVLAPPGRRE
jgi:hypothetical protein